MTRVSPDAISDREVVVRTLHEERERSAFVRVSIIVLGGLTVYSWIAGDFALGDFVSERRLANLERFVAGLRPYPLQHGEWNWGIAADWLQALMSSKGWAAATTTLAISVAAITLAGVGAICLALPAARRFASPEPYVPDARPAAPTTRAAWGGLVAGTRAILIFLRAVPEYVWAFLMIAMVGPSAWAAVLALALHNTGILAKLNAEVVENLEAEPLAALRSIGARRWQIAAAGIAPAILPRFLLLLFYRWETCVREATVLGMLGIVSLGYYVQDARARQYYDVMFTLILLGSGIVLIGDFMSAGAREAVRRSE